MAKYRKKPVVIDAWKTPGHNEDSNTELTELVCEQGWAYDSGGITIPTLEGDMIAFPGDWIIRGVAGEFYPCKPDIFAETYEAV